MIEIRRAFLHLTPDELNQLLDTPIWMALLAAYTGDGKVSEGERASAVRLASLRTFTSPKSIREYWEKVDERFEERFDLFMKRVPENHDDKIIYIEAQVKKGHAVLDKVDPEITIDIEDSLASFYRHVFNADKTFFQYFALPIFSEKLDKYSGRYRRFDEDAD